MKNNKPKYKALPQNTLSKIRTKFQELEVDQRSLFCEFYSNSFQCASPELIYKVRIAIFVLMFSLATNILFTKPLEFCFMWSYWSFHLAWTALFC